MPSDNKMVATATSLTAATILTTKSFFVVIRHHLLPLTNYLVNGQYVKVQPIDSKFAERCI